MTTLLPRPAQGTVAPAGGDEVDMDRDRQLVARAQAGDRHAFDELYQCYYRRLLRFCMSRLHDTHEAEDVVQEAFARAWRALPNFGGDRRFYPWLSVIAGHLCVDSARRRSRTTPVAELHPQYVVDPAASGEEQMVAAVDVGLVAEAFGRLNHRHQRILQLREHSGWSYQAIADHEGMGLAAVETLLWRARQSLKREFAALADSDGRLGGVIGSLVGMAAVRRLLRGLRSAAHAASSGGWTSTAAIGSMAAAAAIASVVVAGVVSSPPTPAGHQAVVVQSTSTQRLLGVHHRVSASALRTEHHRATVRSVGASHQAQPTHWVIAGGAETTASRDGQDPTSALTGVGSGLPGNMASSATAAATPAAGIGDVLGGVSSTLSGLSGMLGLSTGSPSTIDGVGTTVSGLGTTVDGAGNTISGVTSPVGTAISGSSSGGSSATTPLGSTVSDLPSQLTQTVGGALDTVGNALGGTTSGGSSPSTSSGSSDTGSTDVATSGTTATSSTETGAGGVTCDGSSTITSVLSSLTNLVSGSGSSSSSSCPS